MMNTVRLVRYALAVFSIACFAATSVSRADDVRYDFTGSTWVGSSSHTYTGVFIYSNPGTLSSTIFTPGNTAPVQEGFTTTYSGALRHLSITLDNGEYVETTIGNININNIVQAEIGAQVPEGLSLQTRSGIATGTINGNSISNMYLAFLPVPGNLSWDPLDEYFGGNAENMLTANPSLLSPTINPSITQTALPQELLTVFNGGLFLGTNHGNINTVNTVTTFSYTSTTPVPEPGNVVLIALAAFAAGSVWRRTKGFLRSVTASRPGDEEIQTEPSLLSGGINA